MHEALDLLVNAIAERVVLRLASTTHRMVAQYGSPLGSRVHRAAVKRRIERGEGGASVVGRRYLLTHEALQAELAMPAPKAVKPGKSAEQQRIKQEALAAMRAARR